MKRIIVCADGTWNDQDQIDPNTGKRRPTNVTKLTRAIIPRAADGIEQVVYYHDGVGTGDILDRFTGGAFGDGIEINVRDLYRFLVYNFNAGDEIYLFGFSRGAFTVRTLAGFMNRVGLVQKDAFGEIGLQRLDGFETAFAAEQVMTAFRITSKTLGRVNERLTTAGGQD